MKKDENMIAGNPFQNDFFLRLVDKYLDFIYIPLTIVVSGKKYSITLFQHSKTGGYQIGAIGYGGITPFPENEHLFVTLMSKVQKQYPSLSQITLPPMGECILNWDFTTLGLEMKILNTHILNFTDYREQGEKLFKGRVRTDIRFAEKSGVHVKKCTTNKEIKAFHEIYIRTMNRVKANYLIPYEFFYELVSVDSLAHLLLATMDNVIIAGSVFLQCEKTSFYWINASNIEFQRFRPNFLVLKTEIDESCDIKQYLNFGYSHNERIAWFKESWGCTSQKYMKLIINQL